ncbi:MAG TPA: DUF4114 domain-containing protein, partial [Magnetospirillum sp.]|nr:DUF4114 domain-containing protein [Magnetospirillum sp.]
NGASNNGDLANGQPVTFKQVDGQWTAVDAAGQAIAGSGANVLFDNQALNGDGIAHAKDTGAEGGNQNWEDLYNGGDADYNDVSVNVAWGGADTAITDNVLMETSRIDTVVISQYTVTVQTTGTVSATASESNGGDSGLALPQRLSLHFGELRNQLDPNRALTDAERGRGDHDHDSGGGA